MPPKRIIDMPPQLPTIDFSVSKYWVFQTIISYFRIYLRLVQNEGIHRRVVMNHLRAEMSHVVMIEDIKLR
jgi:hypothetical protein